MMKRLLGLSALLGLALVASTADAGPRSPLDRVNQVARFAPDQVPVRTATPTRTRVHVQQVRPPTKPVIQKPGAERIRPSVETPVRATTPVTQERARSNGDRAQEVNRVLFERVQQVARCQETDSCGQSMAPVVRDTRRLMPNGQQDAIQIRREQMRAEMKAAMMRAKVMARKFPGK